ncbi:MAG: ABC transporter ATP-binding protein [Anaerolineaceae bacterium]
MLIELKEVKKIYHTPAGHFTALNGVTLSIGEGEFVSIVGKSGSGKTTLINLVTGIDDPTSGEVYVGDTPVHTLKESDKASWRGSNIGIVFQFFQLLPTLTVLENVMLPMGLINRFPVSEHIDRAMALLELVDLTEYTHQLPSMLSGGLQQKAAIARALANDPPIIATDEPTGNLDSKSAESVMVLFENLVQQGKTILMVTHDPDLAKRAARIIEIVDGKIANNK